ncbi:MFS transporter [Streptomyces sp. NPDC048232]|uniref:MFS transporter n=1 Tax=Streptomyces sp. NPDC048232 TaxID=3365520 RepID=UPI0037163C2A
MLLPAGPAIITRAAGPQRLARAMSILGVPMLLGPVFGPVLGGLLVDYTTWHWIFIVNVPVGILAIALAVWKLPSGGALPDAGRLDTRGLIPHCLVLNQRQNFESVRSRVNMPT